MTTMRTAAKVVSLIGAVAMFSAITAVVLLVGGCMSVERDGFKVRAVGQDLDGRLEWCKASSNGFESLVLDGSKNASTSTRTLANLALGALGAVAGSGGGPAGAAAGAGAGVGLSEIWGKVQEYLDNKPAKPAGGEPAATQPEDPAVTPPAGDKPATGQQACGCDLSKSLVGDPEALYNSLHGPGALAATGNEEARDNEPRCIVDGVRCAKLHINSWCRDGWSLKDGIVTFRCFTNTIGGRQYAFHFKGCGYDDRSIQSTQKSTRLEFRTWGFWAMREL